MLRMAERFGSLTGYPISSSSREAVESFNRGVHDYVTLNGDCMHHFNKAMECDPDFLLLHCVLVNIAKWSLVDLL